MADCKIPFTIAYRKPGTSPPIFVAGTFTDPQWQPQEMYHSEGDDGEHAFHTTAMLEPGKSYQFKIRIGRGDWWVLADDYPTVTDDSGNQNNLLNVPEFVSESNIPSTVPNGTNLEPGREIKSPPPQPWVQISQGEETRPVEDELKTPLFAHECIGAHEFTANSSDQDSWEHESPRRHSRPMSNDYDVTNLDINDPTIEKFPSDRTSILDALRTIQTHLNEDQAHLDDIPPSPRVVSTRRASIESIEETSLSPSLSPTTTRRRESRLSHSSLGRNRSPVSLGSIAEEPKPGGEGGSKTHAKPPLSPKTRPSHKGLKPPSPEEDEAIVMTTSEVTPKTRTDKISLSQIRSNKPLHDRQRAEENVAAGATHSAPEPNAPVPSGNPSSSPSDHSVSQARKGGKGDTTNMTKSLSTWVTSWANILFGRRSNVFVTAGVAALAIGLVGWNGVLKKIQDSLA